ncbi:MAG: Eco29kI family restriction endonuclease [Anaerolineaceae bacterium]|nr:Eco29kI family restriction endonuclease [Anaerolineaceae bacterium]
MTRLWDPLTYENLMAGTVAHFEEQTQHPLSDIGSIWGPGIYALYYCGEMNVYEPICDGASPIYVGKAVPKGSRTGTELDLDHPALRNRLREHARSVEQVDNLELEDFTFRVLAIVPVWIVFAEQALIKRYRPVWNSCLDGFGKHHQGGRRSKTVRSWWDTLHPGRPWTADETQLKTIAEAKKRVLDYWKELGA